MNLYVTDNYTFPGSPKIEMTKYKSSNLSVIYCSQGWADYMVGKEERHIEKDCYLGIPHDTEFYRMRSSEDYRMDIAQFGKDIVIRLTDDVSRNLLDYFIHYRPVQKITGERAELAARIMSYIKTLLDKKSEGYNGRIIMEYFKVLLYEVCNNVLEEMSSINRHTHSFTIWRQFMDLLKKNYIEQHEVGWYADQMNISAKYLSKTVRKVTMRSPIEWINETLIGEAMRLLRETDKPIKSIAYELNFSSPSHFINYFKKTVQITPKDYRDNLYTIYDKKDSPIKYEIIREQNDPGKRIYNEWDY